MLHLCRRDASDECRKVAVRESECFLSTGCVMTEVHQRRINSNSKQIFCWLMLGMGTVETIRLVVEKLSLRWMIQMLLSLPNAFSQAAVVFCQKM